MPGWMIVLVVIEVIQLFIVFFDIVFGALGIRLGLEAVMKKFMVEQVIVLGLVQVVFVAHDGSWENGTPV